MLEGIVEMSDRMLFAIGCGLTAMVVLGALVLVFGAHHDEHHR